MNINFKSLSLATLLAFVPAISFSADSGLQPSISVSEEYNDNVLNAQTHRDEDFITRVLPGFTGYYRTSRLNVDGSYFLDVNYYARKTYTSTAAHRLQLQSSAELLKNLAFLKVDDSFEKVSLDPARNRSAESVFQGQTDRNSFKAEPFLRFNPASTNTTTVGYRYLNTRYKGEGNADKRDHVFFLSSVFELTGLDTFVVSAEHTKENNTFLKFEKDDVFLGYTHVFSEGSDIFASVGLSVFNPENGDSYENVFWRAALNHDFGLFALSLSTAAALSENPQSTPQWNYSYVASLRRKFARSDASLGFVLEEFKNALTEEIKTRKYGVSLNYSYEVTPRLMSVFSATGEKFELKEQFTYTTRFLFSSSATYSFTDDFSASLVYNFIHLNSPGIPVDNYRTNRVIAEFRKAF